MIKPVVENMKEVTKMKFNKKITTMVVFLLGAIILTTSAFADIMLGSGYNSLKNSTKTTMERLSNEVENFSANAVITIKLDGKVIQESNVNSKFDILNNAQESVDSQFSKGESRESYWYGDKEQRIYKNDDGSYNVFQRRKTANEDNKIITNIFEDDHVKDMEKILDALVGNLQDTIQVDEIGGKKMYTGNLTEAQIPSIVNAISSFVFKYSIIDQTTAKRLGVPYPKSNMYLVNAMGKAVENENGIIESGIFTASISAQDDNGDEHIYSLDFSMDIKDINTTIVKAPDLDGKKVVYTKEGFEFDDKHIGKYKNDIVLEQDNSFEKVGERFIEIDSIENGNLKGRYYEIYKEGYKADNIRNFDFYSKYDDSPHYFTIIKYTDNNGENKKGIIHKEHLQNINISFDVEIDEKSGGYSHSHNIDDFNNTFTRIFD